MLHTTWTGRLVGQICVTTHLVTGEDQGIGDNNILRPSGGEHDNFGNVFACKGVAASGDMSVGTMK